MENAGFSAGRALGMFGAEKWKSGGVVGVLGRGDVHRAALVEGGEVEDLRRVHILGAGGEGTNMDGC